MHNQKYSFLDDYSEGCHPKILQALNATNFTQQAAYGNDEYSIQARELIRTYLNDFDASIFFVAGGTLANIILHTTCLRPHEAVITAYNGHINRHETGAIEATGHKVITQVSATGKLTVTDVQSALDEYSLVPHMVKPRMVYISNATEMGTVYTRAELTKLSKFCKQNDLLFLMDGARLGSALVSDKCDAKLEDIARLTDVFWLGGTKMGALIGEAIVITKPELAKDFEYYIKQRGALTAKGRIFGIQFRELFTDGLYFDLAKTTNQHAKVLAQGIIGKGYELASELESNQVFPILPNKIIHKLEQHFKFYNWDKADDQHSVLRLVTSWATDISQIYRFIELL